MIRVKLAVIIAADVRGGIGIKGKLPWRLEGDLPRFKEITMGACVIMGRATYQSIPGGLPGRTMIVVSNTLGVGDVPTNVVLARSYEAAVAVAENLTPSHGQYFVIGGAGLFDIALSEANELYYTMVHLEAECDTFVTELKMRNWILKEPTKQVYLDSEKRIPSHRYATFVRCASLEGDE